MKAKDIATRLLRLAGWEIEGEVPRVAKCVALGVPHTSNWDGVLMIAMAVAGDIDMSFMIKDDWLRGPLGPLMRRLGAIGIDRTKANNVVQGMIDELRRRDRLWLVIPPEGTRGHTDYWKSGFYHIALGAGVPILPGYMDYKRKRMGIGAPIELTGDIGLDMDRIRAFYAAKAPTGHVPADFGPIRLRDEPTIN
ncbi:MAG: lysophospholipid acyltransferase family protein [Myxococcales bacterium]|nr:lysophospholipid acyltransferase family protein [Myxococcales bacterium]